MHACKPVIAGLLAALALPPLTAFAPAAAATDAPVAAPQRPAPAASAAIGLAANLGAIIEAELAAKEQKTQSATNPFLKPRPRPNREHIATANAGRPAVAPQEPIAGAPRR